MGSCGRSEEAVRSTQRGVVGARMGVVGARMGAVEVRMSAVEVRMSAVRMGALLVGLACGLSVAQAQPAAQPAPAPAPAAQPAEGAGEAKASPPKRAKAAKGAPRVIQFEALQVSGQVQKPEAFYILQRSQLDFKGLEAKKSFIPQIIKSVEKDPF